MAYNKIYYFDNDTGNPINLGYLNTYYKLKDWDWSKYYIYNGSKYNTYNSCYQAGGDSSNEVELLTPLIWDKTNGATVRFKDSGLKLSPEKWNGIISIPNLQFSADSDYYYANHTYMPTVIEPGTVVYFCRVERESTIDTYTTIDLSCCDYNPKALTLTTYNTTHSEDTMNVYITYYADTKLRIYIPNYDVDKPLEFNYYKDNFIDNAIPKRLLIELQAAGGGGASGQAAPFPGGTSGAGGGSGAYGCLILKLNLYETTTWRITLGKRGHGGSGSMQPGGSADPSSIAYVQGDDISSNNFDTVYTLGGGSGAKGGYQAEGGDGGTVSRDIISSYYWNINSINGLKGRGENGAGETAANYDIYTLSTYNLMTSHNQNGNQTTRGGTHTSSWLNKRGGGAPSMLCHDSHTFGCGGRGGANGGNWTSENGLDGGYPITIIHLPLRNED